MIVYLKGQIKYCHSDWLILDVNGVGYKVYIISNPQFLISEQIQNPNDQKERSKIRNRKSEIGNSLEVYIYHYLRENRSELYGFEMMEELQMFELLLTVNGVGPKMAMNILANCGLEKLKETVSKADAALLTTISGVGKKIAAKIIVELKNKIGGVEEMNLGQIMAGENETIDAFLALGYKKSEIIPFLSKIPSNLKNTQDKVKWILKEMK